MLDEMLGELRQRLTQHMSFVGQQHIAMSTTPAKSTLDSLGVLGQLLASYNLSSVYNKIYSLPRLTLDRLIFAKIFVIILCFHEVLRPRSSRGGGVTLSGK